MNADFNYNCTINLHQEKGKSVRPASMDYTKEEVDELYRQWVSEGKPRGKGGTRKKSKWFGLFVPAITSVDSCYTQYDPITCKEWISPEERKPALQYDEECE